MPLIAFPPDAAYLIASCSKPEAITGNPVGVPVVPGIPTATIDLVLRQEGEAAIREALSDRIGDAEVAQIDEGFAGHIVARALRRLMGYRGYNRQAGADEEIVKLGERADAFIAACAPGAGGLNGKRITPRYVLVTATPQQDCIRISSSATADGWARSTNDPRGMYRR